MKHLSLRLKGFTGISAGQGKSEIVLDLTKHSDAALVALTGPNGSGKSTLVDNLHPYLTMPSRASEGGGFSFWDHIGAEAEKEYMFALDGVNYRSLLTFRTNGRTRDMKAFLFVDNEGAWVPFVANDGTSSDGKSRSYESCVEQVCGPASLYFTAIHQAQNKRQLHSLANADAKALMVDMLGCSELLSIAKRAKDTAAAIARALSEPRTTLTAVLAEIALAAPTQKCIADDAEREIAVIDQERRTLRADEVTARETIAALTAQVESAAKAVERIAQLRADVQAEDAALAGLLSKYANQATSSREIARASVVDANRQLTDINERRASVERQCLSLNALLAKKPAAVDAANSLPALRSQELVAKAAVERATEDLEAERRKELLLAAVLNKKVSSKEAGTQLAATVAEAEKQAATLETVPCHGSQLQNACELLTLAREASQRVPMQKQLLNDCRANYAALNSEEKGIGDVRVAARQLALRIANDALANANRNVAAAELLAAALPEMDRAETSVADLLTQRAALDAQQAAATQAHQVASASLAKLTADAIAYEQEQRVLAGERNAKRTQEIDQLKAGDVSEALDTARSRLGTIAQCLVTAQGKSEAANAKLVAARTRLADLEVRRAQAATEMQALASVEREQGQYTLLARAFGNDGIVALLIDDAGPSLAGIANDLLLACYGPRFTIEIQTQVATQAGTLKEAFEIVVHDARDGSTKPVGVMSGGERVWIDQCIVKAIAIHLTQCSGRRFASLVSDETDGPLDEERKRQFIAMKREAIRLGGFQQEIFISQTAELVPLADAVISMSEI
ncbi:MAG: hypothetical protein ABL985_06665 [Casimicrobium sp.]